MAIRTSLTACAVAAMLLTSVPRVSAEEKTLAAARELYASAAYDEALTMLNSLLNGDAAASDRQSIELYRTLCLLAVGRKAEADRTVESMIIREPLYRPDAEDIPPRVLSAFSDARKKMLPAIIQQKYAEAKAAFDRQDFKSAVGVFKQVLDGLADPDIVNAANQPPLSDLRTLAGGFHELSAKSVPPLPAPVVAKVVEAPAAAPPVARAPAVPKVYGAEDPDIVAPVTVRQAIPPFPGLVKQAMNGVLELVIDERGTVESAIMRRSMTPQYDRLTMAAAKSWQYQPAMVGGKPVKFRKLVQVNLVPNGTANR